MFSWPPDFRLDSLFAASFTPCAPQATAKSLSLSLSLESGYASAVPQEHSASENKILLSVICRRTYIRTGVPTKQVCNAAWSDEFVAIELVATHGALLLEQCSHLWPERPDTTGQRAKQEFRHPLWSSTPGSRLRSARGPS